MGVWIVVTTDGQIKRETGEFFEVVHRNGIGTVDIVRTVMPDIRMVVDDEGLLKEMPLNPIGTILYNRTPIVGNIVLGEERRYPEPDIYPIEEYADSIVEILEEINRKLKAL